jgi:hypothetical protein
MRRNSTSSMGALHPILFFLVVYGISLFLAIFVCRTVYYSMNNESGVSSKLIKTGANANTALNVTALK